MASIRKRGDSYTITVSCGRDISGKQIRETATFKPPAGLTPKKEQKAVEDFARDFEAKVKNGLVMDGRKISLKEFTDRWFLDYAPQQLQAGTLEKYRQEMDKVLPTLGHLKLTELRPPVLNSFFVGMTKDGARRDGKAGGYSKGSITKTRNVFSSILRTAVEWEVLDRNPLDKVRIQADDAAEKLKFFTPDQAALFLNYIEKPYTVTTKGHERTDDTGRGYTVGDYQRTKEVPEQLRVLFNLAIYAGLRKGELLALEWSDIDFECNTVSVSKAVSVVAGQQITKAPKTKNSRRVVSIPQSLTQRIHRLRMERIRYRLSLGDYWKGGDWIFIQHDGKQMSYSTPYAALQDILLRYNEGKPEAQQLPPIPFHGLRHPYVKHTTKIFSLRLIFSQAQAYSDARQRTRGAYQRHQEGEKRGPFLRFCNRNQSSYCLPHSNRSWTLYAISMRLSGNT